MKTYDVTIRATVTKTIRVTEESDTLAIDTAHSLFTTECDGDEHYEETTLDVTEVEEEI